MKESFLIQLNTFIKKETSVQLFFCEFCEIFKNSLFKRTPTVVASGVSGACNVFKRETLAHVFSCKFCKIFKKILF